MTLREFVDRGTVGTRAEREHFESGLVDSVRRGLEIGRDDMRLLTAEASPSLWEMSFLFARSLLREFDAWRPR